MTRSEKAKEYFKEGYNCAQSVCLAFKDKVNISEEDLLKIASGFGGGMGRLRETCGAVSGMFIIVGLIYGYNTPETGKIKAELYERIQKLGLKFENDNGSLVCRELLNLNEKHSDSTPSLRNEEFYKKRPCIELIGYSAQILEEYINENIKEI